MKDKWLKIAALFAIVTLTFSVAVAGCTGGNGNGDNNGGNNGDSNQQMTDEELSAKLDQMTKDFPQKKITLIAPYAQGGGTDALCRATAEAMREYVDVPIVVVNKPGGGGSVGIQYGLKQPADGYTLQATSAPSADPKAEEWFKYDDWEAVGMGCLDIRLVVTAKDSEFNNMEEMVEFAKENPGEVKIGVPAWPMAAVVQWEKEAGIDLNPVVYGSDAKQMKGLVSGETQITWTDPGEAKTYLEAGKIKTLGITASEESNYEKYFPEATTFGEMGWPKTTSMCGAFRGLWVRTETPNWKTNKLRYLFSLAYTTDTFQEYLKTNRLDIRTGGFKVGQDYEDYHQMRRELYSQAYEAAESES